MADWSKTKLSPRECALLDGVPGLKLHEDGTYSIHRSHYSLIGREGNPGAAHGDEDGRLRPYQVKGVEFLEAREGALLGDSCGLGKTRQTLAACRHFPVVIVGPKIAVRKKGVWLAEITEFHPDASTYIITGREQSDLPDADFYLINYEILRSRWGQFLKDRAGTLIIDEAHKISNRKAERTTATHAMAGCAKQVYALTATPMPNRPANLWAILHCVSPGAWGGFWDFARRYADARPNNWGWEAKGLSHKEELRERLAAVMIQRFWFEVSDEVPQVTRERMEVELAPKDASRYRQIARDLREAVRKKTAAAKLQQITALRKLCGMAKARAVVDFVADRAADEPVVIWIWHQEVGDEIARLLKNKYRIESVRVTGQESGTKRDIALERFDSRTVPVLIAQYEAAGVSADFTVSRMACFAELDWLPLNLQQAEGRTWRWKQNRACLMYYFVVEGSVEDKILRHLWEKAGFTAEVFGDRSQVEVLGQIDESGNVDARAEILAMVESMISRGFDEFIDD